MKEEKLENLLNELAESGTGPVRPGLAEDIKQQIPDNLTAAGRAMNTINIIVDLRINKLVAAAAIILAMVLLANFFSTRYSPNGNIFQEGRLFLKYLLGVDKDDTVTVKSRYEHLVQNGKDVVYYGLSVAPHDSNAVLMHWKTSDGKYKVLFADFREREVSAEELIKLQAQMLQKTRE
jgi:hypothetical protein